MEIIHTKVSSGTFIVNGRKYASIDEMPPEDRARYQEAIRSMMADRNANGIPDIFEETSGRTSVKLTVNGTVYNHVDEVPAQYRQFIADAISNRSNSVRVLGTSSASLRIPTWIFVIMSALLAVAAIGWLLHTGAL
jgi:hypothetical protein